MVLRLFSQYLTFIEIHRYVQNELKWTPYRVLSVGTHYRFQHSVLKWARLHRDKALEKQSALGHNSIGASCKDAQTQRRVHVPCHRAARVGDWTHRSPSAGCKPCLQATSPRALKNSLGCREATVKKVRGEEWAASCSYQSASIRAWCKSWGACTSPTTSSKHPVTQQRECQWGLSYLGNICGV